MCYSIYQLWSLTNSVCKILRSIIKQRQVPVLLIVSICIFLTDCAIVKLPYRIVVGTVKGTYYVVKGAYELTAGTVKVVYKIGEFTFKVVKAPIDWALINEDIETIDDLPPREAIRKGRVKNCAIHGERKEILSHVS